MKNKKRAKKGRSQRPRKRKLSSLTPTRSRKFLKRQIRGETMRISMLVSIPNCPRPSLLKRI
jgi:hypothetical protein